MKTIRFSGRPVELENLKRYEDEWKSNYDAVLEKHGADMLTIQQELAKLETELQGKYKLIENLPIPASRKQVNKMIEEYQCPIMFAKSKDAPHEVVMVLMDMPLV